MGGGETDMPPSPGPLPTPTPTPTPTLTPKPTPSPTVSPTPRPSPSPTPKPPTCTLDTSKGVSLQVTMIASKCTGEVKSAVSLAAIQNSGTYRYCRISSTCTKKAGGKLLVKAVMTFDISLQVAQSNIIKSFSNGKFYAKFKEILPNTYNKYKLQTASICIYPSAKCTK